MILHPTKCGVAYIYYRKEKPSARFYNRYVACWLRLCAIRHCSYISCFFSDDAQLCKRLPCKKLRGVFAHFTHLHGGFICTCTSTHRPLCSPPHGSIDHHPHCVRTSEFSANTLFTRRITRLPKTHVDTYGRVIIFVLFCIGFPLFQHCTGNHAGVFADRIFTLFGSNRNNY